MPRPVPFPLLAVKAADLGLGPLGVSPTCAGEEVVLSTRATRADDRGVMLPLAATAVAGVPAIFALGVPGADLTVGDGREAADVVVVIALAATLGVRGVRAVRFDASVGFNGLAVLRSVDIGATEQSLPAQLSLFAQRHVLPQSKCQDQDIQWRQKVTPILLLLSTSFHAPHAVAIRISDRVLLLNTRPSPKTPDFQRV
jgi:hypothetical protein